MNLSFRRPVRPLRGAYRRARRQFRDFVAKRRYLYRATTVLTAGLGVWTLLAITITYVIPVATMASDDDWVDFERAANRAQGVLLRDARSRHIGLLSSAFDRDHLESLETPREVLGYVLYPDHKTVPVEDAPEYFWRCLVWLEDRHRGTWRNPFGIDLGGVWKIPFSTLAASFASSRLTLGGGGSTIEMQIARSMWKQYPHNSDPFTRKLAEWWAAPILRRHLVVDGDERLVRAWSAQHLALIQGAGGQKDVYGTTSAALLAFGKEPQDLSVAEQLILAAAVHRPMRLRQSEAHRTEVLHRLIENRAMYCVDGTNTIRGEPVIPEQSARVRAIEDLLDMLDKPYEGPFLARELQALVPRLRDHRTGPRYDPQRLAANLALPIQRELVGELGDLYPETRHTHPWRGKIANVDVSIDIVANSNFEREIEEALVVIERQLASRPASFVPGTFARASDQSIESAMPTRMSPLATLLKDRVPVLAVVVDAQGRVIRYANTGGNSYFLGVPTTRYKIEGFGYGRYDPARQTRQIASIGKVALAVLLAEHELDADEVVPNICPPGITQRCMDPITRTGGVPFVSIEKAFAESLNAPLIHLADKHLTRATIESFMATFGFHLPVSSAEDPIATSLVLGRFVGRPRDAVSLMHLAHRLALGDASSATGFVEPHFIDAIIPTASAGSFGPFAPTSGRRLQDRSKLPHPPGRRARQFLTTVLRAPICFRDRENHATLRRLSTWCDARQSTIALHIAKSGTTPTAGFEFNETDWWIVGAVELESGASFTYLVTAGLGIASAPFASNLGAGTLAPVVDAILRNAHHYQHEP